MDEKQRVIIHVDMDHFFSAVEERENPSLKGKPVVVGADPKEGRGRGVVKTCNYEARDFGIHSGMPISKAWKFCPTAVFVPANYGLYRKVSGEIMAILRKTSDKFEQWGLDEAFIDVSSKVQTLEEATELARNIKRLILESERLTCSIGIAPNKLVAKIASDYRKPNGLTVVLKDAVEKFLAPLQVRRMLWVGKKTESKLNMMGIRTIGDLAACDASVLTQKFGVMGARYNLFARGICKSEVAGRRGKIKSVGHECTFETNTDDCDFVFKTVNRLCQRIQTRIAKRNALFRTVTVKIRGESFQTHTHRKTLPHFTNRLQDLQKTAQELVRSHIRERVKTRLIGVRVSNLTFIEGQKTLM